MTAKEWLGVMQQAADYDPNMTRLIKKYGEMLVTEKMAETLPSAKEIRDAIRDSEWDLEYRLGFVKGAEWIISRLLQQKEDSSGTTEA